IDNGRLVPVYGLNLGTIGFLMNRYTKGCRPIERIAKARPIAVSPLRMEAVTQDGRTECFHAINEVSLLRATRHRATIAIGANADQSVSAPALARRSAPRSQPRDFPGD